MEKEKEKRTMATTAGATHIVNGQVVQGPRPISITDHLMHVANLAVLFFTSIVSTASVQEQVARFNGTRGRNYGGSSSSSNNQRVGSNNAAGGTRSNVNTFGPAAQAGCSGGS